MSTICLGVSVHCLRLISALEVFHVMRYTNLRLLTYLLTIRSFWFYFVQRSASSARNNPHVAPQKMTCATLPPLHAVQYVFF